MGDTTGIAWTQRTWNPWRGCTRVSEGCRHCYMFTQQKRYGQDPSVVVRTKTWDQPLKWQRAAEKAGRQEMVFSCSWSDWFHVGADPWRDEAWDVVRRCPNLVFQVLTKRASRLRDPKLVLPADWGDGWPNVWLGVSVEDQATADARIPHLLQTPARVRFLSCEPLLGPVDLEQCLYATAPSTAGPWRYPSGRVERGGGVGGQTMSAKPAGEIHWAIAGGESGPDARPCDVEWVRSLVRQCESAGVACFVKQLGARPVMDYYHGDPDLREWGLEHEGLTVAPFGREWVEHRPRWDGQPPPGSRLEVRLRDRKGGDPAEWPEELRVRQFPRQPWQRDNAPPLESAGD